MNLNNIIKESIKESIINYFYESLNSQKQKYGDELVNKLLSLDPSKAYKYIEQICNYYNQGISEKEIKKYIDLYNTKLTKNLIPKEYSNINNIKSFKDLKDIVDNKSIEASHTEFENNLMKEIYLNAITTDKGTFDVYRPYNTLQQIKLGKNTKWCISSIKYKNMFNQYFIRDNMRFYIFIKDNDHKYQLDIFPNSKKEVWNTLDKNIGCDEFKRLTDIDCSDYDWYPINQYVKDIIAYDQYGHKVGRIINNNRDGEWITYYENGNIKYKEYYKNDKLDGEYLKYYENGKIEYKENYKDDKLDGEWLEYYNGKIEAKKYYKNGKLNGEKIIYYENGNIKIKAYYKDGILNGEQIEYYDNGNIKTKANYTDELLDGDYNEYYKNGNIHSIEHYKNGLIYGEYIEYDENGNIINKGYYKDGIKVNDNE